MTLFALPFVWELGSMVLRWPVRDAEVTLMAALRNLGLGLAAMAHWRVYARLSALVSLFLVTVASSVGGEGGMAVLAPVGGFALVGTLWLIMVYWEGLGFEVSAGAGARRLPISGAAWVLVIVAVVGRSRGDRAVAGGDCAGGPGAYLRAAPTGATPRPGRASATAITRSSASEHPQSVGFTESEIYLETDRPSLYDSFNETYGEPLKPKKQEKMIALGPQDFGEQKERPAENLHAGREFSAVRRKPVPRPRAARRAGRQGAGVRQGRRHRCTYR